MRCAHSRHRWCERVPNVRAGASGGALRRSELVALDVEDLEFDTARGLKLTIRKSKTDQQQAGAQVAVPYARETDRCAVRALSQWLPAAKIRRGPMFRRMRRGDTVG